MSEPEFKVIETSRAKLWLSEAWGFMGSNGKPLLRATLLLVLLWSLVQIPVLGMVIGIFDPMLRAGVLLGIAATFASSRSGQGISLLGAWEKVELRQPLIYLGLALILVSLLFSAWMASDMQLLQEGIAAGAIPADVGQRIIFAIAVNLAIVGFSLWLGLPELVFRGGSPVRAIVCGIKATMANWRVLTILGLWLLVGMASILLLLVILVMLIITALPASPIFGFIALLPAVFVMVYITAFMFVLQFICWRDILFHDENDRISMPVNDSSEEETRVVL